MSNRYRLYDAPTEHCSECDETFKVPLAREYHYLREHSSQ